MYLKWNKGAPCLGGSLWPLETLLGPGVRALGSQARTVVQKSATPTAQLPVEAPLWRQPVPSRSLSQSRLLQGPWGQPGRQPRPLTFGLWTLGRPCVLLTHLGLAWPQTSLLSPPYTHKGLLFSLHPKEIGIFYLFLQRDFLRLLSFPLHLTPTGSCWPEGLYFP